MRPSACQRTLRIDVDGFDMNRKGQQQYDVGVNGMLSAGCLSEGAEKVEVCLEACEGWKRRDWLSSADYRI